MKRFSEFEVTKDAGIVIAWGRFNPPSVGHETVFNEAARLANHMDYDLEIYSSQTSDDKKNPLLYEDKLKYLIELFPRYKNYFVEDTLDQYKNIADIIPALDERYRNLIVIAGQDRVDEFQKMIDERLEQTFDSVEVWSAGERDPDSKTTTGVSSSKMREFALSNDFASFVEALPNSTDEALAKSLFESVQAGLSQTSDTRENLYNGTWAIGQKVELIESADEAVIRNILANHVEVEIGPDKIRRRVWADAIKAIR